MNRATERHGHGPAPLVRDCGRLCEDVVRRFGANLEELPRRICATSLDLLAAVTLAVKGRDTDARIEDADDKLATLRVWLRLAGDLGVLADGALLQALELCDAIGRQIGGWQRQRGGV